MERTLENIAVAATTLPPGEAVKILNDQKKGCLAAIEAAEATLKIERAWLASYRNVVPKLEAVLMGSLGTPIPDNADSAAADASRDDEDVPDEGAAPQWETPDLPLDVTPEGKILALIAKAPATLAELTDALIAQGMKIKWHGVYNIVDYGAQSLVKRGVVLFDKRTKPARVHLNPDYKPPAVSYSDFVRQIHDLDTEGRLEAKHEPVVKLFAEGMKLHTRKIREKNNGKRVHAYRTWNTVKNKGLIGAIEGIVMGPATSGYSTMIEIGRPDLLAEKIVIDHPHLFSDEAVEAAQRRWDKLDKAA